MSASGRASGIRRPSARNGPPLATAVVAALAVAWTLFVGSLAVARHDNLRTNAFDLGYIAQTLWNTAHGEPYRLTVLEGATFRPEGLDPARIRRPHSYLAFHIEPILPAVAALYALWPDPRLLLWLQAAGIALGALPIAWLAAHLLAPAPGKQSGRHLERSSGAPLPLGEGQGEGRSRATSASTIEQTPGDTDLHRARGLDAKAHKMWPTAIAIAFGAAYLLAPGLEGAALSDFHLVALAATWLAFGLWLLETRRTRAALACFALAALSREDAALLTAWLGVVLAIRPQHRRVGITLALGAGLWTAICFAVIAPYFNGGGSLFWSRYDWLGPSPLRAALATLRDPRPLLGWLASPDVASYLALQLLTGGVLCLLAPLQLLVAAPILAMNALSSFDWMRSGGAHYSALLAPVLLWSAAHGAHNAASLLRRPLSLGEPLRGPEGRVRVRASPGWGVYRARLLTPLLILTAGLGAHLWAGVSPLRPGFIWPSPDPRAPTALAALQTVPPDAAVSASSDLYPHLASRHRLYWFPAQQDATWIALDAVGTSHPLTSAELHDDALELLGSGDYAVEAADAGVLVLRRGAGGQIPGERLLGAVRSPGNDPEAGRPADMADRIKAVLPPSFYSFADADADADAATGQPPIRFGDQLDLVAWRLRRWPQVGLFGDTGTLETVWRARAPPTQPLRFALVSVRRSDGAIIGVEPDAAPGAFWLPTTNWQQGRLYRLEMPVDRLGGLGALGVAVLDASDRRLPISAPADVPLWEGGTIARLVAGI